MSLIEWGWSPEHEQAFRSIDRSDLLPARVARQDKTGYLVVHAHGEDFARLPGHLREDPPAVGDWVALDPQDPPTIRAILPRRSAFLRQAAGRESRSQVVAANVDVVFLVAGLDGDLNLRRLERYLVLAAGSGARPVVVLNKADLCADAEARMASVRSLHPGGSPGTTRDHPAILLASATTGIGVAELRARIPAGVTAAFLGSSGVGKSSLVNAILGEEALETGGLRKKDGRGRHTTTARHLVRVPGGGVVLDTPGMRELHLWDAEEGISEVFADVEALAARCRFRDCAHDREPGCAVREGVGPERLASWRKLQREAASSARRADVARSRADARAWGKMAKRTLDAKRDRLS